MELGGASSDSDADFKPEAAGAGFDGEEDELPDLDDEELNYMDEEDDELQSDLSKHQLKRGKAAKADVEESKQAEQTGDETVFIDNLPKNETEIRRMLN